MNVLALEPYLGGSHQAFLSGWSSRSQHAWTILGLPARHWKWRMRHAAITFARQVEERVSEGQRWDVVVCSDMLNLAEFRGLITQNACAESEPEQAAGVGQLPCVAYFHENQLTYPVRRFEERDYHFAFTNFTTALAADRVWFNSEFHRREFLGKLRELLARMPDYAPRTEVDQIEAKAEIMPPGIEWPAPRTARRPGPMRILWAARWEHDKNPDTFFAALKVLVERGVDFRVSVIGEQFRDVPGVFAEARPWLKPFIERWGYQPSRDAYLAALGDADVVVSTATHEFFGLAVVEAIAAGAYPILPRRLAYPELLDLENEPSRNERFFYDGSHEELADRLAELARRLREGQLWRPDASAGRAAVCRFQWDQRAPAMDQALEKL